MLPEDRRQRYAREFIAELHGMTRWHRLRHCAQVLQHAPSLGGALRQAGPLIIKEDTLVTTTQRPWRCRFRLHTWDEQENPETRERYEICARCDAYRERPRAAPGASAAGMNSGMPGGGIF